MQIVTGHKGQPHITANDDQGMNQGIFGNGTYVLDVGGKLAATAITANEIQIADGEGVFQGVHFRVDPGTYDTVTIDNGTQGYKRKDLIVCRYTKNASTGVENTEWIVKKGTPAASNPTKPAITSGDILSGATTAEMAMYEIVLDGINISAINKLFTEVMSIEALSNGVGSLAVIETSSATQAHAVNSYLVYNGTLYKVISAIAAGESLTVGTNIRATTAGAELSTLNTNYESGVFADTTSSTGYVVMKHKGATISYNTWVVVAAYNNGQIVIPFVSNGIWYVKVVAYSDMSAVANTQCTIYYVLRKK